MGINIVTSAFSLKFESTVAPRTVASCLRRLCDIRVRSTKVHVHCIDNAPPPPPPSPFHARCCPARLDEGVRLSSLSPSYVDEALLCGMSMA